MLLQTCAVVRDGPFAHARHSLTTRRNLPARAKPDDRPALAQIGPHPVDTAAVGANDSPACVHHSHSSRVTLDAQLSPICELA